MTASMDWSGTLSRRRLLTGRDRQSPLRPPGVAQSGLENCTACGACVEACPTGIISLADRLPILDFSTGECTFCGACAKACPEPVFDTDIPVAFDHVAAISEGCLAKSGITCMACRDACPEEAIRFRPRIGGPFLPEILTQICTGCGACVAPCPAGAVSMVATGLETANA